MDRRKQNIVQETCCENNETLYRDWGVLIVDIQGLLATSEQGHDVKRNVFRSLQMP